MAVYRRAQVPKTDAIRVFGQNGNWMVDYGSYVKGFHVTRREAVATATKAARDEGRELLIEPEVNPPLFD
jgi:hypothetical protein